MLLLCLQRCCLGCADGARCGVLQKIHVERKRHLRVGRTLSVLGVTITLMTGGATTACTVNAATAPSALLIVKVMLSGTVGVICTKLMRHAHPLAWPQCTSPHTSHITAIDPFLMAS